MREEGSASAEQRIVDHDRKTVWTTWSIICIGLWVATGPATFGYRDVGNWVEPSGGRGPWFADTFHTALRADLMTWSDVGSGLLLVILGVLSLRPNRPIPRWGMCLVGVWLLAAPVVLWAPTLTGFVTGTAAGTLVIALSILVPGMPNMRGYMVMGEPTPPGWSYNPSSWAQRSILIALGLGGFLVSRYLAAYQLGYVTTLWDPFFGFAANTQLVLDSKMSHAWPVSDAGLGTVAYTLEFLMGWMGGPARWRTMPWMVTIFGVLVVPLGLAHVALVMSQPVMVGQWCTFCLVAALFMLPMIPLEIDEVVAMLQHVRDARRRGDRGGSLWKIFWLGGGADGCTEDTRSPSVEEISTQPGATLRASVWGASITPTLLATASVGVALLFLPALFSVDIETSAADVAHLGGAFVLTAAVVAMGEVTRIVRWLNVPAGLAVAGSALLAAGAGTTPTILMIAAGLAVAALSVPRGRVNERYGTWQPAIR